MFLQKYRYQLPQRNNPIANLPLSASRKQDVSLRISAGQLKSHQNKANYSDPRKFLIENTQKAIGEKVGPTREVKSSMKSYESKNNDELTHRESFIRKRYDLSKREDRIMAAKKYRERIWKSNDIASLIRAQQQLAQSRKTEHFRRPSFYSSEKVQRYRDLLKQFGDETTLAQKQKLKKQWLAAAFMNNNSQQKNHTNPTARNPELQVTNIEFMQSEQLSRSPVKMLMNRERRKQMIRRTSHVSYTSHSKRPNTTGTNPNKFQENFIQPW